jgi:hypothetical protein
LQFDHISKVLQIGGAVLGIPAAMVGTYSAYQTYFTNDAVCTKLRGSIVSTMDKNLPPEAKRGLLSKEIGEFEQKCARADPDSHAIFRAAIEDMLPHAAPAGTGTLQPSPANASLAKSAIGIFGMSGGAQNGWVAISRKVETSWHPNFSGYSISETALPPAGTVLTALQAMPVWQEPQGGANDEVKLKSSLPRSACVRVVATRVGPGRLWAEVVPASCS